MLFVFFQLSTGSSQNNNILLQDTKKICWESAKFTHFPPVLFGISAIFLKETLASWIDQGVISKLTFL